MLSKSIQLGFLFCVFQIAVCLLVSPKTGGLGATYLRLVQWDSYHYISIVQEGYHLPSGELSAQDVHNNRANVGYFPAYPVLARELSQRFQLDPSIAILLVAQFFCFLFWTLTFLLFLKWGLSTSFALWGSLTILFYPASFFLVAGYSESLFMAALVGFLFASEVWQDRTKGMKLSRYWVLSAMSGYVLSATRLVGIPLIGAPVFRNFSINIRTLLLSAVSLLGAVSFFGWSQWQFGQWDLYLKLQKLGWGNEPDYKAIFYPSSYVPWLFFEDTTTSVCRASNLFILGLMVWILYQYYKNRISLRRDYFYCAISMFFISISGKAAYSMDSMVRYNFPVFVMLVMIFMSSFSQEKIWEFSRSGWRRRFWILGYLLAAAVQVWMIRVFTKGGWVA